MTPQVRVLDEISLVAPLGLRFWDVAAQTPVTGLLDVELFREEWPTRRWTAVAGPSGVYSFHGVPGLIAPLFGDGEDDFWTGCLPSIAYAVDVADPSERYLGLRIATVLPNRGLFARYVSPLTDSLTPDATWVPLFSSPARPVPAPFGLIRAQIQDDVTGGPAAYALLNAQAEGGMPVTGMADARGVISLAVPYPEPKNFALSSPLGTAVKLTDQSWSVTIGVNYSPGASALDETPFLDAVLSQSPVPVWSDTLHAGSADSFLLKFGVDLVLRSRDAASGRDLPVLLVSSGSPL